MGGWNEEGGEGGGSYRTFYARLYLKKKLICSSAADPCQSDAVWQSCGDNGGRP